MDVVGGLVVGIGEGGGDGGGVCDLRWKKVGLYGRTGR